MSDYQLYSVSNGPVSVISPMDCSIPEYLPHPESSTPRAVHTKTTAIPFKIDYSRFINDFSSKRQPSQLREICNYNNHNNFLFFLFFC